MADKSNIEWTDATWNPITGCSPASPGCKYCYAMRLAASRLRHHPSRAGLTRQTKAGPVWTGELRYNEQWLRQPIEWKQPRKVFVVAHGDLFHENTNPAWLWNIFDVMDRAPWHIYQIPTKRPHVAERFLSDLTPRPNWIIGASVEDQKRAVKRRPPMSRIAAQGWHTFVSYEPAIGPVDWLGWEFIKWMISGGENGPRPTHPVWHQATRDWCRASGIPYLFKQWGLWKPISQMSEAEVNSCYRSRRLARPGQNQENLDDIHGRRCLVETTVLHHDGSQHDPAAPEAFKANVSAMTMFNLGKGAAGRVLDGRTHDDFPTFLQQAA